VTVVELGSSERIAAAAHSSKLAATSRADLTTVASGQRKVMVMGADDFHVSAEAARQSTRPAPGIAKKSIFELTAQLAKKDGVVPIGSLPGCWERQIDERWTIVANGHSTPMRYKNMDIPPYSHVVLYNGLLAGMFDPFDGMMVSGTEANEDNLIRALEKAIAG
jgi:hypothetical protein